MEIFPHGRQKHFYPTSSVAAADGASLFHTPTSSAHMLADMGHETVYDGAEAARVRPSLRFRLIRIEIPKRSVPSPVCIWELYTFPRDRFY